MKAGEKDVLVQRQAGGILSSLGEGQSICSIQASN